MIPEDQETGKGALKGALLFLFGVTPITIQDLGARKEHTYRAVLGYPSGVSSSVPARPWLGSLAEALHCPILRITSRMKAGKSPGCREVIRLPSTTTSLSSYNAPTSLSSGATEL